MKKVIGILLLIMLLLTNTALAAFPEEVGEAENYDGLIQLISEEMIEANMIEDDVYKCEQTVNLNQEVIDGNVYVLAREMNLTQTTIYGDVYVMAETVNIENCEIRGSVYAMGESIAFSGNVNDIYAMGSVIDLKEEATIWRSARVFSDRLNVNAKIKRNLLATAQTLNVLEKAVIDGELNYSSKEEGNISQTAQVGNVEFTELEDQEGYEKTSSDYLFDLLLVAFKTFVIALIIVFFVNKFKGLSRQNTTSDFLKSFGKGIGVLIILPVLAFLLMISIIGSTLGVTLLAIYAILLYVAISVLAIEIAYRILKKENKWAIVGVSILVAMAIRAIGFIPGIGGAIRWIALLIGLGVLWNMMFQKVKNESNNGEINEN